MQECKDGTMSVPSVPDSSKPQPVPGYYQFQVQVIKTPSTVIGYQSFTLRMINCYDTQSHLVLPQPTDCTNPIVYKLNSNPRFYFARCTHFFDTATQIQPKAPVPTLRRSCANTTDVVPGNAPEFFSLIRYYAVIYGGVDSSSTPINFSPNSVPFIYTEGDIKAISDVSEYFDLTALGNAVKTAYLGSFTVPAIIHMESKLTISLIAFQSSQQLSSQFCQITFKRFGIKTGTVST